eukprot:gene10023-2342_t
MMIKRFFRTKHNFKSIRNFSINEIEIEKEGILGEENFKIFLKQNKKRISFWKDIPLKATESENEFYFVNEIPRGTKRKMEISLKTEFHPIVQDVKNNKLREFTYGNSPFNYGALPQTYEDPKILDKDLQLYGDDDPVDVVEISNEALKMGHIYRIKVLGIFALIDEGEVDWKVISILSNNNEINTLEDVKKSKLDEILHWFRYYKTTDGKPENSFGYDSKIFDSKFALKIIKEMNQNWKNLIKK